MSPFVVRRYRAERLLRDEFEGLRKRVIGGVSQRLRAVGARLDASDLDACYSQAWQGLYAAVLDGAQIDNPAAWLALVTYRRAIDEHRSRRALSPELREHRARLDPAPTGVVTARDGRQARDCDIAAQLDDQARLRQLFEALRVRLSKREQQAATLCYLQGLSRADAAARMGVSESRMRKLMEGRGDGSPGVAAKVGALVHTIGAGEWCEQQGSLMRALAYGILDPEGERYRVALLHRDACPACRAYVLSLRGLAAVLPPAPLMLHWALGAGAATGAASAGVGGATGAGGAVGPAGSGAAATGAGAAPAGAGLAGGALSASSAAGVGAAGGSWWFAAGPLGAKLAVGCLLALGVGAGCAALGGGPGHLQAPVQRRHAARDAHAGRSPRGVRASGAALAGGRLGLREQSSGAPQAAPTTIAGAARASREFGPEQATAPGGRPTSASAGSGAPTARAASAGLATAAGTQASAAAAGSPGSALASGASAGSVPAAQREFAPG
jgi:RNA polymerase sigma factor (sigma-70 family)